MYFISSLYLFANNSKLQNNDYCRVGVGGMNVFSYNMSNTFFLMGVRSHIGSVDLRLPDSGRAFLRNSATIHGDLNMHILTMGHQTGPVVELGMYEDKLKRQSNVEITENIYLKYYTYYGDYDDAWKGDYQCNLSNVENIQYVENKVVQNGEAFLLSDGAALKSLRVQGNSTLIIPPGEFYIDSLLQLDAGTKIEFTNPGESSVIHLNGRIIWHPQNSVPLTDTTYWTLVARGFKLIQHSSKFMFIEGAFGGTIYAPLSKLILGQTHKILYGRFFAKDITVHQFTKVYRVDYNPVVGQTYAVRRKE